MTNSLKMLYYKLIGDTKTTILQARIFHHICFIVFIFLPAAILSNLITSVPYVSLAMFIMLLFTVGLYYNSRFLGNTRISTMLFTVCGNLLLITNYFLNSGIHGPTMLIFILSAIFIIAVIPSRQHVFWLSLNGLTVIGLLGYEYINPVAIKNTYSGRNNLFTDVGFSYLAVMACIILILSYILQNYREEKKNAYEATLALRAANEAKTKLLSIISHDLKSPLNSIQSFLELLLTYGLEEDEEKAIKSSLLQETKNTQSMLFNMLNWTKSQMDAGVHVNLQQINIAKSLEVSIDAQNNAGMEKMITFVNDIDPHIYILADLEMLRLVVRNLVNNAFKFTEHGGEVSISTKSDNEYAAIVIKDNGIGIAPDKQKMLFSLNTGTTYGTNNEKGVGLGLLLCKEFTELQGGRIIYDSVPGEGSTFELIFPIGNSKNADVASSQSDHSAIPSA